MKEPEFWKRDGNPWLARVLLPAEGIYALATAFRRWRHLPYRPPVPVVVAGGLTLGGSGKTPLALALDVTQTINSRTDNNALGHESGYSESE